MEWAVKCQSTCITYRAIKYPKFELSPVRLRRHRAETPARSEPPFLMKQFSLLKGWVRLRFGGKGNIGRSREAQDHTIQSPRIDDDSPGPFDKNKMPRAPKFGLGRVIT